MKDREKKQSIIEICRLCGEQKELTFDHIPPKSAYNNKLIFMQDYDNISNPESPLFGKKQKSHKGFGKYSLCRDCNNNTGHWYAKDFAEFVKQGMAALNSSKSGEIVIKAEFTLKPLNVLKQILTMFFSADSWYLIENKELVRFILERESQNLPEGIKVFLYFNDSSFKRMLGVCHVSDEKLGIVKWSEINFKPFGYLLAIDSPPPNKYMVDITEFFTIPYDQKKVLSLTAAYLPVANLNIGTYGPNSEIQ